MEIINFSQMYEQEVVDLWNRACYFDSISLHKFRQQALLDDNFDENLSWIALKDGKVVGFLMATKRKFPYMERGLEPERGWINVIFVDAEHRNQGIGQALYHKAEHALKDLGCTSITLGAYSPGYFFAGLDKHHYPESVSFFIKNGYHANEGHYSMGIDLHGYQIPKETLEKKKQFEKEGYSFVPFTYPYALELISFVRDEFGGGWKRNVMIAMRNGTAENTIILVLSPENKICGFVLSGGDGTALRFGPIGIAKELRSSGIGGVLLELKLYDLCTKGTYRTYFMTTDDPGRRFYERHGIRLIREYVDYRKNI